MCIRGKNILGSRSRQHKSPTAITCLRNIQETSAAAERGRHERQDHGIRGSQTMDMVHVNLTLRAAETAGIRAEVCHQLTRVWVTGLALPLDCELLHPKPAELQAQPHIWGSNWKDRAQVQQVFPRLLPHRDATWREQRFWSRAPGGLDQDRCSFLLRGQC